MNDNLTKNGLNDGEVEKSRHNFGSNGLTEVKQESFFAKLLANLSDPIIKILIVALALNLVFVLLGYSHWYETVGIFFAIAIATLVSTFFEYRNETTFQRLQAEAGKIYCKVYRNGVLQEILIDEIVTGDLMLLQTGDKVPADGIIVQGELKADQSVLNGEAEEITKQPIETNNVLAPKLQDKFSIKTYNLITKMTDSDFMDAYSVFRGSIVLEGNALLRVLKVGNETIYGSIVAEIQTGSEVDSPLKVKLTKLAQQISKFGYIGAILIFVAFLFLDISQKTGFDFATMSTYFADFSKFGPDILNALMLSIVIIVMAVPEGLPLMISIVSAMNMSKMLNEGVFVRKIAGIETAGSLNLLFTDKTGTITKGKLEVILFEDAVGRFYNDYTEIPKPYIGEIVTNSVLNSNAQMSNGFAIGGNSTEKALLTYVNSFKNFDELFDDENIRRKKKVAEFAFDSKNKYSAVIVETKNKDNTAHALYAKGAPEKLLPSCTHYLDNDGEVKSLDNLPMANINARIDNLAERQIRVIALATADLPADSGFDIQKPLTGLTLIGFIGIRDDIREESKQAIKNVQDASVQVVMITGDRKETAVAIAKECGIIKSRDDLALTSQELARMSDDEVSEALSRLKVVARALPSDKSRLVRISQSKNLVVAMTGDGVNDSPALRAADVGFAMGSGTEVAKEASEFVILDDNFISITNAIRYGRTIFNSIRKFIAFQLTINVSAVLISAVAPLFGFMHPLNVIQILWVNLIMDTLAALAFGGEPALRRYMQEKPKRRDENIVSKQIFTYVLSASLWIFAVSLFFIFSPIVTGFFRADAGGTYLRTGYFAFFVFAAVFNAFIVRSDSVNLLDHISKNMQFVAIMLAITLIQIVLVYVGGEIFESHGLAGLEWVAVLLAAVTVVPVGQAIKAVTDKLG
ncbi:MAG: cation-translocating P-type ATPase [Bifidobacteriaceae bacterium]|jgi:calcium-translocating P-type ATPase|nr:cation-translocating P-type ATPase [Bifidobacteriaceae bacterium]